VSLDREETARTSRELAANLDLAGLAPATVAASLGFSEDRLRETLAVSPASRPADVWLLRDFLDQVVRDRGGRPEPWTVLTDEARRAAETWFALRPPPATPGPDV
jgi:hypothetical protein